MRHEEDRAALLGSDLTHFAEALLLESGVPDREHLIDEEDFRLQMRGHRKGEAHEHSTRVALDRRIEKRADLGEINDLVELPENLVAPHAEDRPIEEDILAPGELGMKAGADLEERSHATPQHHSAGRWLRNA